MNKLKKFALGVLVGSGLLASGMPQQAIGAAINTWEVRSQDGRARLLLKADKLGNVVPAGDGTQALGDLTHRFIVSAANMTASQVTFKRAAAVTVSTNLTVASPTYLGVGNMTAVIYLPDATTVPAGRTHIIKSEINTAGNIGVWPTGSQTVDGATNANVTTKGVGRFVTDGANWFAW